MYQRILGRLNQLAVTVYKSFGSTMLALILLGLLSYLGGQAFFLVSTRWIVPAVVSPTDHRIVELSAQLAEQSVARDRIIAERRSIEAQIADADRQITAALEFQHRYREAMAGERSARTREQGRLASLRHEYERARSEVLASNQAYGDLARHRTGALHRAQLIDQEQYLTENHALAQLAESNLALAEEEAQLATRDDALARQLSGLRALVGGGGRGEGPLPPDLLMMDQQFVHSGLELARQARVTTDLEAEVADLDTDLARFNQLLETLRSSPYLEAIHSPITVAFVPYENEANAKPGTPVWGCTLLFLWCHPVGTVAKWIPGEVQQQHPVRRLQLRGNMITLSLNDPDASQDLLLHLGRAPLGF